MDALLVGLLTALPLVLGAYFGFHLGGLRLLAWGRKVFVTWICGIGVALCGIHFGWHRPFGLVTPVVLGLLTTLLVSWLLLRRRKGPVRKIKIGFLHRSLGMLLGAVLGFLIAVAGWQVALFVDRLSHSRALTVTPTMTPSRVPRAELEAATSHEPKQLPAAKKTAWASLAEIAHRGFIQHLPVVGPLTNEMLAVATILKTPQPIRNDFAKYKKWDSLADLPSFQAIADNESLFAEIDAAVEGNLAALYRLQKHPLIIEFYHEESLQAIITHSKASQIASELAEFQNRSQFQEGPTASER